jgi:hypothetical protein
MNSRNAGFLGVGACVVFWLALLIFGSLRPSYSQSDKRHERIGCDWYAECDAVEICGIHPSGLVLSGSRQGDCRSASAIRTRLARLTTWLLSPYLELGRRSGVFPALIVNGVPVIASWHTRAHLIVGLISGIAWVVGILLLIIPMKRNPEWGRWYLVNVAAVLLVIVGSFGRGSGLPDGLVQRVVDAIVFAWFALMSIKLIQVGGAGKVSRHRA